MNLLSVRYIGLRKPGRKFNCIVVGIQFRSRFTSYLYLIWIEIPCSLERYYNVELYSRYTLMLYLRSKPNHNYMQEASEHTTWVLESRNVPGNLEVFAMLWSMDESSFLC